MTRMGAGRKVCVCILLTSESPWSAQSSLHTEHLLLAYSINWASGLFTLSLLDTEL